MKPNELLADARAALAAGTNMTLTLPRGAARRLPGFPRGELLCESHDGRNVYSYKPEKVIAWLKANLCGDDLDAPPNAGNQRPA